MWGVQWRRLSRLALRSPPLWWQQGWPRERAGSVAEAELLAPLGELLMPGIPLKEMLRSFKSPPGWGGNSLEPDLTTFGLLKDKNAALFVEYDGYYRHGTKEGMAKDLLKNEALLGFAPPGSFVVRINHKGRSQLDGHVLWVGINPWGRADNLSLTKVVKHALQETALRLQNALHPGVHKSLKTLLGHEHPIIISVSAHEFREATVLMGKGNTADEISAFLNAEGFGRADIDGMLSRALLSGMSIERSLQPKIQFLFDLGLTRCQIAKAVATHPPILGRSTEQNLKPTVQWFLDLGLKNSQVAKAVATHPQILGYSIERNLKSTVQWFLDLGLTKSQVAKAVATHPPILGLSIERNLDPTVQWFLDLGLTKSQVAKAVATFPQILGYSIEQNLKPTVQWFMDLGLARSQIAKAVAISPQILGCSIEQKLKPTAQWFLDFGLTKSQVAKAMATFPRILGYSMEQNLKPTAQWLLDLGLTRSEVAKAVGDCPAILGLSMSNLTCKVQLLLVFLTPRGAADVIAKWPRILSYSQQRLEERLSILASQDCLSKLVGAMALRDEAFHRRFVAPK